jgi:hypothetical protein
MKPSANAPIRTSRRFGGRWLRPTLVCLGSWVAITAIFYAEEDWRGQRDWNRYRQAAEARGESLDFRAYIPKPVPNAENFAASDIVQSWLSGTTLLANDPYAGADTHVYSTNTTVVPRHRQFTDLVAWQMAFEALQAAELTPSTTSRSPPNSLPRLNQNFHTDKTDLPSRALAAPVVLEGLKPDEDYFAELRLASARPYSRFPLQYDSDNPSVNLMWHFSAIKVSCLRLSLRACAELAAGQTEQALADVKLMLYLADTIKGEPFLISHLVRVAYFQFAIQPVWEGLAERRWTEVQLQELQTQFRNYDFFAGQDQAFKAERAFGVQQIEVVKRNGVRHLFAAIGVGKATPREVLFSFACRMMPSGWYDLEGLNYCTAYDTQIKKIVDPAGKRVFPRQAASNYADYPFPMETTALYSVLHHQMIAAMIFPSVAKTPAKTAVAQTAANQAAIACALERYRLAKGQFPEKLESLTPQYISRLPNDVITGQPYKYRRTDDGQFILYSVGWNEKDDGGVPGTHGLYDDKEGDWVWDYPVK